MNMSRRGAVAAASCTLAAVALGASAGCGADTETVAAAEGAALRSTFFAFDTVCVVGGVVTRAALDAAITCCEHLEQLFSRTIATSDVARVNAAAGAPTSVDAATIELIDAALAYRAASGGSFDITIGAVSELWDFVAGVMPSADAIAAALPHVGAEVVIDAAGSSVTLPDSDARIDLGGIAKGYVADAAIATLAEAGATSAYVNLGGNVAVLGSRPDGTPWRVGVRDPFGDATTDIAARIDVTDGSVVTSGLYERAFTADGRRWWHILDPRTGYPVETNVASATVVSARSLDADGYTKPLFFMGTGDRDAFFDMHPELQVLLILDDGTTVASPDSDFSVA